jgi:hypothetical protein
VAGRTVAPSTLASCENTAKAANQKPPKLPALPSTWPAPSFPTASGNWAKS